MPGSSTSERKAFPSCFLGSGALHLAAAMAPSPGTPLGGERGRRRSLSPPAAGAASGVTAPMVVDAPSTAAARVLCPVPSCPCSDAARHRGWANIGTMKHHIDAHLSGNLRGEVPSEWLRTNARTRCLVCGLSVSVQYGVHPTCRPAARAALGPEHTPAASAPPALPTMQEIHGGRTPTLRHVPAAARYLWNKTPTRALAAAAHHNDLRSWQELAMLPQTVLDAPRRGGRQHARAAAAYTKDRLQRWDAGERLSLWETRQQPLPRRARRRTDEERRELAVGLAREGFDGKACAALLAEGLCADTPATVAALQSLHPTQASPPPVAAHELPVAPELSPDDVLKALHTFPAATAPGPSGLRAQHLRDAFLPGAGEGLLQQLTAVVNLLAQGRACAAAAPGLAGANLVLCPSQKEGCGQ